MSMENEKEYFIAGALAYESKEAADKALAEQSKIIKLESQMDYSNPKVVYSVYTKIIERNMFSTYEGMNYLIHLQNYLTDNEEFLPGPIMAIPASVFSIVSPEEVKNAAENEEKKDDNSEKIEAENSNLDHEKREMIPPSRRRKNANNSANATVYKIIIAFLVVIIVGMLFIALRSDSPNIINYRKEIQNEYANWEQQLREKEAELNKRERELNNN